MWMHTSRDEERPNARRLRLCLSPRHLVELLDLLPASGDLKRSIQRLSFVTCTGC